MNIYAVIDTNVLVSALLNWKSIPGKVLEQALIGKIIPVLNKKIVAEYDEVLRRKKFPFQEEDIEIVIQGLTHRAEVYEEAIVNEEFPDKDDMVFYAVTMESGKFQDTYLVTGNIRHFPTKAFVVTPREMIEILEHMV